MKAVTKSNAALKRIVARLTEENVGLISALEAMRGERHSLRVELSRVATERDLLSRATPPAADTSWSSLIASAIGGFIFGALAAIISIG